MKYNLGDKVKIREDLLDNEWYGAYAFSREMTEMKGKVVTIERIIFGGYKVKECSFNWTDEMFESLLEPAIKTNSGMDVTILFYKGTAQKVFHNIINIYSKDDMLCLRTKEDILKIPLMHILYVKHKHGNHIGSGGNI